jgi:hypothetical protein
MEGDEFVDVVKDFERRAGPAITAIVKDAAVMQVSMLCLPSGL